MGLIRYLSYNNDTIAKILLWCFNNKHENRIQLQGLRGKSRFEKLFQLL
jgi:hypothetical protein